MAVKQPPPPMSAKFYVDAEDLLKSDDVVTFEQLHLLGDNVQKWKKERLEDMNYSFYDDNGEIPPYEAHIPWSFSEMSLAIKPRHVRDAPKFVDPDRFIEVEEGTL